MVAIFIKADISDKTPQEKINIYNDLRKSAMGDYEDKELLHEWNTREQEVKEINPEEFNYSLK